MLSSLFRFMQRSGLLHWLLRRHMTGAGSLVWEFVFYATFGIVVTSSVAIAGVLLVFSFLIIPAAIGVMFAGTLSRQLAIGWIVGTFVSASGLAGLVCLRLADRRGHGLRFRRVVGAGRRALSVFAWRSPVGDALHDRNRALDWCCDFGGLGVAARGRAARRSAAHRSRRMAQFHRFARSISPAQKQRRSPMRANTRNAIAGRRSSSTNRNGVTAREGEALDDFTVARISSFLKSYGEMRKGEQFVDG